MTIDFSSLPPEHTCKDARSLQQIYEDNIQNEHDVFRRNVDSTLDYYHNQYCTKTWGSHFVDALTDDPDITIREFFENAAYGEDEDEDMIDLSLEENAEDDV